MLPRITHVLPIYGLAREGHFVAGLSIIITLHNQQGDQVSGREITLLCPDFAELTK